MRSHLSLEGVKGLGGEQSGSWGGSIRSTGGRGHGRVERRREGELLGATALLQRAPVIEGLHANLTRLANDTWKDSLLGCDALRPKRRPANRRWCRRRSRNQWRRWRRSRRRSLESSVRGERPFTGISSAARGDADGVLADAVALAVGVFRATCSEDDKRCGQAQHGRSFRVRGQRCSRWWRSTRHRPSTWADSRSGCWRSTSTTKSRENRQPRTSECSRSGRVHPAGTAARWGLGRSRRRSGCRSGLGTAPPSSGHRRALGSRCSTGRCGEYKARHQSGPAYRQCPAYQCRPSRLARRCHPCRPSVRQDRRAPEARQDRLTNKQQRRRRKRKQQARDA